MFSKICLLLIVSTFLVTTNTENADNHDRRARFAKPAGGIFGFFQTVLDVKRLYDDQYNDTTTSLRQVLNILNDGFTDTATKKTEDIQQTTESNDGNTTTTSTTTERYRISRQEFGRILGRNYRGLQKLLRLELNDAANQSQFNIKEYRKALANALTSYTVVNNSISDGK